MANNMSCLVDSDLCNSSVRWTIIVMVSLLANS